MASKGNGLTPTSYRRESFSAQYNEWISLAFIKLGIDRPEAVIPRAFVENHALVPKTTN